MSILNTYVVERERFASLNCNCTALPNCGLPVVWMAMTAHLLSHPDSSCSYCQSMYSHPNQQHGYPKNTASPATFRKDTTFYPTLNSDFGPYNAPLWCQARELKQVVYPTSLCPQTCPTLDWLLHLHSWYVNDLDGTPCCTSCPLKTPHHHY